MLNLGPWEVGLILLVALIVVGPGKLPEVAKSIGKGMNEFKKVTAGYKKDFQEAINSIEETVKETDKGEKTAPPAGSIAETAQGFDQVVQGTEDPEPGPLH
ncbi:MAG: twin-arginine translocase TatA/TatE family subunit [Syntrophomonadaceae bacterium]